MVIQSNVGVLRIWGSFPSEKQHVRKPEDWLMLMLKVNAKRIVPSLSVREKSCARELCTRNKME